ncbi:hypothetical protein [Granulicella sp. dw_53]|uniref:hypothetical protein n=1 Tax=Granulicella sp. dw_53 TaxID=2719792 RepID=UPI001BD4D110|nr:hypothetical protein [Granulicella sp. dw_53]
MRRHLQLATLLTLLGTTLARAQFHMPQLTHKPKDTREDLSWLAPFAVPGPEGRASELVRDPRFKPFLRDHLTAPQTFWNDNQPLPETVLEFLGTPRQVLLDDNRYLAADGCVRAFCPARGLLFIDLGTAHPLVVFAAIDWVKENKTTDQSGAEYTLWLFANRPLRTAADEPAADESNTEASHIPAALTSAITRWAAQPIPGSSTRQNITHAILVDPDGTPHQISPATIGAAPNTQSSELKVTP